MERLSAVRPVDRDWGRLCRAVSDEISLVAAEPVVQASPHRRDVIFIMTGFRCGALHSTAGSTSESFCLNVPE